MKDTHKFVFNPDFRVETFDNEILLYSILNNKGVYLNETAHLVLAMCEKKISLGEIISILQEAFPDQREVIRGDVTAAIECLIKDCLLLAIDK